MKPESMDNVFQALASSVRRKMLDIVRDRPGCNVTEVCRHFDVSRIAVMKHLTVLEQAGLLISEKRGRARHLYFNTVPIQMIHERWTSEYSELWAAKLTAFKYNIGKRTELRGISMAKSSPEEMAKSMIKNMPEKTGKSLEQWLKIVGKANLAKHGEIVKHLKSEHGVTHGFANLIAHQHLNAGKAAATDDDLVASQYAGAKEGLRPIYEALIKAVGTFGSDVEISPKKAYVSLRRSKQFALIQPSTKDRVDVGINLKGEKPGKRLEASGSFNAMVSHRVRLSDKKEVNAELKKWLRQAYDAA